MGFRALVLSGTVLGALSAPSLAGVVNPDISAIGQILSGLTDDPGSPDASEPTLALGESELILEAALNPYFRSWFTLAAGEEGVEVEEAYASWVKGLPWGLGFKGGQYRLGFGKLNPVHPHAYPFQETPRALSTLLPGEEGFNEPALQASVLLPTPGDWASHIYLDLIKGGGFHPDEEETRLGWIGRWSNDFLLGGTGALEAGVSGATGIDHVAEDLRGYLGGLDLKLKFYGPRSSQLVIQGETVYRRSHTVDSLAVTASEDRLGGYAFVDIRPSTRFNFGVLYDQAERAGDPSRTDRAVKPFAGFAILEESTLFRVAYEFFMPDGEAGVNTLSLQFLFSMGPHKPHQF